MPKVQPPELKKFMDKKLNSECAGAVGGALACVPHSAHAHTHPLSLPPIAHTHAHTVAMNANRQITGTLRGFDQFMNLVLDGTVDVKNKVDIGMVVSRLCACHQTIRHGWCCSVCGGGQTHPCTHAWS